MSTDLSIIGGLHHGTTIGLRYRLVLPHTALRGRSGSRLGLGAGASLDFHDYRDYHPGDDIRHLDWSVYARSDKEVIKLFREEVAPHLDLILDTSRSMDLPQTPKAFAAATITAACATAAAQARCSRTVWLAGELLTTIPNSHEIPSTWPPPRFTSPRSPDSTLLQSAPPLRPHGVRIFISDLMWPADPTPLLCLLSNCGAATVVIQLLTSDEESPQPQGACRLEDAENHDYADLMVDAAACSAYSQALIRHRDMWSSACRACGATFVTVTAESLTDQHRLAPLELNQVLEVC